jgi:hypothetical protein
MAITVKQPIGSILYYIKGTIIYSGILCGWESYGYTCIFFQIEPNRKMIPNPEPGRLAVFTCDVVPSDILYPTAEAAVDACIEQKKKALEKAKHDLICQEIDDSYNFEYKRKD